MQMPKHEQEVIIAVRETVYYKATYDADGGVFRLDGYEWTSYEEDGIESWTPTEWQSHDV